MAFVTKSLQVIGGLSIAAFAIVGCLIAYSLATNSDKINKADQAKVEFIFNWSGLNAKQEYKVLSSFESARSLTGDHLDYYCIQLTEFRNAEGILNEWAPFSKREHIVQDAISQALSEGNGAQCFSRKLTDYSELQTYIWSTTIRGDHIASYDIITFDPQTKRILFVGSKT